MINKTSNFKTQKKIKYVNTKIEYIRIIKATNFDFFSKKAVENFLNKEFIVTKLTDRMGMRIKGPIIENNLNFQRATLANKWKYKM